MQEKLLTATKSPRAGPSPGHHTTMVSRKPLHAKELQGKVIAFVALALVVTAALVALLEALTAQPGSASEGSGSAA